MGNIRGQRARVSVGEMQRSRQVMRRMGDSVQRHAEMLQAEYELKRINSLGLYISGEAINSTHWPGVQEHRVL